MSDSLFTLRIVTPPKITAETGREMAAFAESVKSGKEPPISYEQIIGVTRSTFAAVESLRTGETIKIS